MVGSRFGTMLAQRIRDLQVASDVAVVGAEYAHRRQEGDAMLPVSIKAPKDKRVSVVQPFKPPFWDVDASAGRERERHRFPADDIDLVIALWEFCDCECAIDVYD